MLLYSDTTYKIRRSIFNVYNYLGNGHKEQVYQKALESEFVLQKIPFDREKTIDVKYKGNKVGSYRPDFIIDNKIVIEIKAVAFIPREFEIQLLHYIKTTGYKLGFLVNFGADKIFIKRLIWTKNYDQYEKSV